MADPELRGSAYAFETLKDLKKIFEALRIELNNDIKDELKLSDLITRGIGQSELALDATRYQNDKMTIVIEKGDITQIKGAPLECQIRVMNFDKGTNLIMDH